MATATNFLLLKPNLLKWNQCHPRYHPVIQHYSSIKNSFIPLKINSNFKALTVETGFSTCKLKENPFEILAKRFDMGKATLALIRHSYSGIHYDASSFSVKESADKVEKRFKQLSIEERGKFDNINKKKKRSTKLRTSTTGISNEYIEVTILVAAKGVHSYLPFIKKGKDLKDALLQLATIPYSSTLLAVEVLWTPQYEDDTPSEEEFLED
ncbi:hypothetical protein ACJIZ3_019749 [Penstemon smallii]|uniref:Uncharacterized protein n=1 Tax=Penstemon smallii TaxID=265156 RepID=A0ABD3T3L2_9LAMI